MATGIVSPYIETSDSVWLRGNLHAHTSRSDGRFRPQELVDIYAGLGYDFLALSDHDMAPSCAGLDARGMLLLPCSEVSAGGPHVLAVGCRRRIEPLPDRQRVIDRINAAGGMAFMAHPNWEEHFDHCRFREELLQLAGYAGIEVFNGGILELPGSPLASDKWDRLLSSGRRVWGIATDDCHWPGQPGRGWVVVRARRRSSAAILSALRRGSFYASSGVRISSLRVRGTRLRLTAPDAEGIAVIGESGARLAWVEGQKLVFDASRCNASFFRVECYGRAGRMAWTQPFMTTGEDIERRRRLLAERPLLRAARVRRAPVLTGSLSDPAWRRATVIRRFLDRRTGRRASPGTTLHCLVAGGRLFLGARCEEPRMDQLKLSIRENGHASIWADDSIELFLDVEGGGRRYFHLIANAAGFCYAVEHNAPRGEARELQPMVKTGRCTGGWTLELAVPLAALGVDPGRRARIGFNALRNRQAESGQLSAWSHTGASNHRPDRFGWLELPAARLGEARVARRAKRRRG